MAPVRENQSGTFDPLCGCGPLRESQVSAMFPSRRTVAHKRSPGRRMGLLRRFDLTLDDVFTYRIEKTVDVQVWQVGVFYRACQTGILAYLVLSVFLRAEQLPSSRRTSAHPI